LRLPAETSDLCADSEGLKANCVVVEAVGSMLRKVGQWRASVGLVLVAILIGCGGSSSSKSGNVTATPTFSPGGGAYNTSKTVTIADATSGAVLYCTTDGTTPTTSSPVCAEPTTVYKTEFLQAIAVAPGKSASAVASAAYTIDLSAAATPTFSPAGGSYTGSQQVTIADATTGANIYYTVDGSVPSASSALYTGPVTVSSSETLSAIAVASGYSNSGIASATYTINQAIAAPVFSVASGNYTSAQTVTITDATPGATIYYAINATASASSTPYAGPITVSQTEVVSAIAVLAGNSSPVATAAYSITLPQPVPAPTFSPASGGTLTAGQTVTIADGDANASVYYTSDGSTPTASSTQYTAPVALSTAGTVTIKAIAIDAGTSSAVATATYTVTASTVPAPTFSPASGTVAVGQTVTIADGDAGASIYYTIDGSTPTASSTHYSAPIALSTTGSVTIKAIAIDSGTSSSVATAIYTVSAAGASLSGTVLSGTKPVSGAQVQLYAAGQSGYGSNATTLDAAVTTDSSGAFTVSGYSCPASPGDLVYLVATGGDTGSGANSGLELMTALGPCGSLSSTATITVNEVTTVASAYALSPFMTAAPNVGSSSTNYQGLANAFATVSSLVDTATGTALSITPAYAASPVAYLNSSTAPQARVDTLANILNACADSNGGGGGCSNLFSAATPASGTAPANTLQAILNIALNPGAHASSLFSLASPTGPFQPELSAAPGDWTLALTFTGGGLGLPPGTSANVTVDGTTLGGAGPTANTSLAIDAKGNIWVTAYGADGFFNPFAPMLAGFDSQGAPLTPATTLSPDGTEATYGGFNPEPANIGATLNSIAIDPAGNLWVGDGPSAGNLIEVKQDLTEPLSPISLGNQIGTIAIDNNGNVWVGAQTHLSEFKSDGTPIISNAGGDSASHSNSYGALSGLTFDSNGGLWSTDASGNAGAGPDVYQISTSDGSIIFDAFPSGGAIATLAADSAGNIYGCGDPGGQSLDVFIAAALAHTYSITSGRGCANQLVLDGQGHIFAVLNAAGGLPSGTSVDEFTSAGVAISPAAGYTGTSSGEAPTLNPDPNFFVPVPGVSAAVDGSGNLWILNNDTNGISAGGNVLVKFVGIAAPVATPTSLALKNGQLGVRP